MNNWREGESQFWVIPWPKHQAVTMAWLVIVFVGLFCFTLGFLMS